jgi:hypothetical protein
MMSGGLVRLDGLASLVQILLAFTTLHVHRVSMENSIQKRVYSCWIVVEPSKDIPGVWLSHCLNFDVISQGETPQHALEAVCEAVEMVIVDDLTEHLDPLERGPAPHEDWERLGRIISAGTPIKLPEVSPDSKVFLAKQVNFEAKVVTVKTPLTKSHPDFDPNFEPVSVEPMQMIVPAYVCQPAAA